METDRSRKKRRAKKEFMREKWNKDMNKYIKKKNPKGNSSASHRKNESTLPMNTNEDET